MRIIDQCDYCPQQMICRNLYVALRILGEEIRCAENEELKRQFMALQAELKDNPQCRSGNALQALNQAEDLLQQVRREA